jgi:hypothetical protein
VDLAPSTYYAKDKKKSGKQHSGTVFQVLTNFILTKVKRVSMLFSLKQNKNLPAKGKPMTMLPLSGRCAWE